MIDTMFWGITSKNDEYYIGNINIREIADTYGTPIHVINETVLKNDITSIRDAFKNSYENFQLYYSYKTNWTPAILEVLREQNVGAEIISPFELWLAREIGIKSNKIIYNGIIKTEDGLENAIKNPIQIINVDTLSEIQNINRLAQKYNKKIQVGLRLCPKWGWNAQFGFSVENGEALQAVEEVLKYPEHLELTGLLIHTAEASRNADIFLKEIRFIFNFIKTIKNKYGKIIEIIDLGGGFGVPSVQYMSKTERVLNYFLSKQLSLPQIKNFQSIKETARQISVEIKNQSQEAGIPLPKLHIEPGRAMVSRAQFMIVKVHSTRKRGRKNILMTDGGKQNSTFPLGYEKHFYFPINKTQKTHQLKKYFVVGRVCSPTDFLFKNIKMKNMEINDYIVILDTGAYFNSHANNFSFPRPATVMINENNDVSLVREHEKFQDLIKNDFTFKRNKTENI